MRQLDKTVPASGLDARSVWSRVEADPDFVRAGTVLLYMSIGSEVPTSEFIAEWKARKNLVIPKVSGEVLELYRYDESSLVEGYHGILEPSSDAVRVDPSEIEYAIIPGVAFAMSEGKWVRMGRGKGYYDRLLPHLKCPCVGVAWSYRHLENIPTDPWDRKLDRVFFDND